MKKCVLLLLCGLLIVTGCTMYRTEAPDEKGSDYMLYFRERDLSSAAGEGALRTERAQLPDLEGQDAQSVATVLMEELL